MNKRVLKLASSGKRLGAYCLDKIVPFVLFCVMLLVLARLDDFTGMNNMYGYGYGFNMSGNSYSILGTAASVLVVVVVAIAYLAVQLFFYTKSKTLGKAVLGLQVISSVDGQPVGILKMILREWFAKKASGSVFLLGYLWILIDEKHRGWHDKIVDTYVVDLKETLKYNTAQSNDEVQNTEIEETEIQDVVADNPEGGTLIG